MKNKQAVLYASVFLSAVLGVSAVNAEEGEKVIKKGGIPHHERWKEADLIAYLRLPRIESMDGRVGLSMDDILGRIKRLDSSKFFAKYDVVESTENVRSLTDVQIPIKSFELRDQDKTVLLVSLYDYRAWNTLCEELLNDTKISYSLWNVIPNNLTVELTDDKYVLTRKSGRVRKWHFSLKNLYVVAVVDIGALREGRVTSEENVITEVDKVIREIVSLIESEVDR